MPAHVTVDQKRVAFRRRARGPSLRQIGLEVGSSGMGASVVLRDRQKIPERGASLRQVGSPALSLVVSTTHEVDRQIWLLRSG
jgi:hypothetical protein